MTAYYNEFEPFAAEWLENLIAERLIPDGIVDRRSITEVQPADLRGFVQCHFFAGIGGWPLGLRLAGWPDDREVWTGSCPCQPFSSAGKQKGKEDARHLWPAFFRLIKECGPDRVIGEQVERAIGHGWLDGVFGDLEAEAYTCGAIVLGAHSVGSPHIRQRLYWMADAEYGRQTDQKSRAEPRPKGDGIGRVSDTAGARCVGEVKRPEGETRHQAWMQLPGENMRDSDGLSDPDIIRREQERQRIAGCEERDVEHGDSEVEGIQHAESDERDERWAESSGRCVVSGRGSVDGLGHTNGLRLWGKDNKSIKATRECVGPSVGYSWDDYEILPYHDSKRGIVFRRSQPCSFPLAYGLPRSVGSLLAGFRGLDCDADVAKRILLGAKRNRKGRLKGYGNAILPQDAEVFIRSIMEATERSGVH